MKTTEEQVDCVEIRIQIHLIQVKQYILIHIIDNKCTNY